MSLPSPDLVERRDGRVLLVWGDAPYWLVVDDEAAAFVDHLAAGRTPDTALRAALGHEPDREARRAGDSLLQRLAQAGVTGRPRRPAADRIESITINVTNRCSLNCAFCYNRGLRHGRHEVSADAMIAALESVRRRVAPGAMVALLGGEPLLEVPKTLALARWARRRGYAAIVSTNGLLVDDDFARQAADLGLDCQVSLDAPTAAGHDAVRGAGTFAQAVAGIERLVAAGVRTICSMVVHADNTSDIPDYLRLVDRLGAAEARFIQLKRVGGGSAFEPPDLPALVRRIAALVRDEPHLARLLGRDYVSILARTCRSCSPRHGCGAGSQTLLLDADGQVYPCPNCVRPEWSAGGVTEAPLLRLWDHSPVLADFRRQTCLEARPRTCGRCVVRHWCLGGCRGESYDVTGRLDAPGATCAMNRQAIIETFWALWANPSLAGEAGVC